MKKLILFSFACIALMQGFAQSYVEDVFLSQQVTALDHLGLDSIWNAQVNVRISDTFNIKKVHLKIGSTDSTADILDCNYNLENEGLNSGCASNFSRNNIQIMYALIGTSLEGSYFYRVELEDLLGNIYLQYIKEI